MIKILEVNPNTNDAMSFYRGRGPLAELQKKYSQEINIGSSGAHINHNWDFLCVFHMVFMLRPFGEEQLSFMKTCKQFGIPIWIDYDDLLTDVPLDNPAWPAYGNENSRRIINEMMSLCTVASFSTRFLMEKMGKDILDKSVVIPNALNQNILRFPSEFYPHKKVMWRGSHTHVRDLKEFEDPIRVTMRTIQQRKDRLPNEWNLKFLGMNSIHISDYVDVEYNPYMDKNTYFRHLSELRSSINIVPLSHRPEEIAFNKSKSNISWIESTYGGAVTLAPDWDEWRKPGIINYKDKNDFSQKLTAMIDGKYDLKSHHQKSWQYIQENLTLDQINEDRYNLIKQCCQKPD